MEDDDLEAGFADTPTATPASQTEQPQGEQPNTDAPAESPEVQQPQYAQITVEELASLKERAAQIDEIRASHTKGLDTAFGKIGGLERIVNQLQGLGVSEVTDDDFQELRENYPELLEAQVKGINRALAKARVADPEQLQKVVTPIVADLVTRGVETRLLSHAHPDWEKVVAEPEFATWRGNLPAAEQQQLGGWDSDFIGKKLTEYKATKKAPAPPSTSRKDRLAGAVNPRGAVVTSPASSDDDDFEAGFTGR